MGTCRSLACDSTLSVDRDLDAANVCDKKTWMERLELVEQVLSKPQERSMKQEFVGVGPMMMTAELTVPKHGSVEVTTCQWMLTSSRSTALVKNRPVHGTLLEVDVIPRTCGGETRTVSRFLQAGK